MRCLWEISIRSLLREISQRPLSNISKELSFLWRLWDVSKTSQKRSFLCDVFKTSRAYLKKDVFPVTSLRRLKSISRKYFWFSKDTSQKWFRVISVGLLQYLIKKINMGPSETLKKWNMKSNQLYQYNQSSLFSGLISTYEFWQVKDL